MAQSFVEETIPLAGVDLKVARRGAGPPLLMLHGGGGPMAAAPFAARLAGHYEVIAPVHPGFAGTQIPDHFDSLQDLLFLYLDLIDALDLRDALVMGFSMGGWLAAELAVLGTPAVGRLVLVDSVGIKTGDRESRDIPDIFGMPHHEVTELLWHNPSKAPDLAGMSEDERVIAAANRMALGFYAWSPYMHNPKLPGRLHRIKAPTHLIWGEADGLVTPAYGEAFRALIPGATMTTIAAAGHLPQLEQPDAFVDAALAFAAPAKAA